MQCSERTGSVWKATATLERPAPLEGSLSADVCIVGGGIAGMTTAYLLGRAGRSVVVLSGSAIGGGETGQTTAHLASANDDRFYEIERLHGDRGARIAYESHAAAIDRIEAIVAEEHIDCDFRRVDGYLFRGGDEPEQLLRRELAAAHRAGFQDAELVARAPVPDFDPGPCLRFPRQGQFHPLRYIAGLSAAVRRDGGLLFSDTLVTRIAGGEAAFVETSAGARVDAKAIVIATNSPVVDRVRVHSKQVPFRTYVVGLRVPSGAIAWALYWDTLDPYHYVRLTAGMDGASDLLLVGGEDHRTGEASDVLSAEARWESLERWARARFPAAGAVELRWSGQVMEPFDAVAFIGRNPMDHPNVFIATGDSGQGMTHGTIAGMLLCELVQGRSHPWQGFYDPSRKTLRALGQYVKDNLGALKHLAEHLGGGEIRAMVDVHAGEGAILQRGGRKIAVYRTEAGMVQQRSAVCPHLGCVVHWNGAEKSWDCPCHGSRFAPTGEVLTGPAVTPLKAIGPPPGADRRAGSRRADEPRAARRSRRGGRSAAGR